MEALLKLKSEGVIGAIGFSSHATSDSIVRTIQTDAFDYVNLWHSYIYQFNAPAIIEAKKHDMGVFIISPNDKGGMLYDPPEKLVQLTAPLNPMTFNDVFILQNPDIHTISCGAAKPADFDIHIEAVDRMNSLADEVSRIKERLDAQLQKVVDADWARRYLDGVPPQNQTPEGLNIPIVLWLWNLVKAFNMTKYAKMRYNLMGNAEHWFPGCKPEIFEKMDRKTLSQSLHASAYAGRILDILDEASVLMRAEEVKRLSQEDD
jgi:predicted aldo/keto reductase-like oxidoreductase